jgi:hypothetical protein
MHAPRQALRWAAWPLGGGSRNCRLVPRMGRKPKLTAHQQRSVRTRLGSTETQPKFDASKLDSSSAVVTASACRQSTLAMLAALARASRSASIGPEISSAATRPVGPTSRASSKVNAPQPTSSTHGCGEVEQSPQVSALDARADAHGRRPGWEAAAAWRGRSTPTSPWRRCRRRQAKALSQQTFPVCPPIRAGEPNCWFIPPATGPTRAVE